MINLRFAFVKLITVFFFILAYQEAIAFEVKAKQAYLMDYQTGACLFEKNGEERMVPSSMTKVMTAYVVFKNLKDNYLKADTELPVSEDAWRTGGTKMFVSLGSMIKVSDLLRGVIVQSGNDASKVLAEGTYGDESTFAEHMNREAQRLGMHGSHFQNASGLPHEDNYSTAKDMAILAASVIKDFPEYYHYFSEREFTYNKIYQHNKNLLLGKRGIDGLKTGHTEAGGYGIVISAQRDGRRLIAVVNGLSTESERLQEADKLLNYGFSNFTNQKLVKANDEVAQADVWYGDKKKVTMIAKEDIEVTLDKATAAQSEKKIRVVYDNPVVAPIVKGQIIGKAIIEQGGAEIATVNLVAKEDIGQAGIFERLRQNIEYCIKRISGGE